MKIAYFVLAMALLVTGCANQVESLAGSEDKNPLIAANYGAAERLFTPAMQKELLGENRRILVASYVDINQVSRTSLFGKMMAEQLASRLVQLGVPVVEVKLRSSMFVSEKGGEMLLSREIKEIGQQHNAEAVVVGTYADAGSSGVYVTVKVVKALDGKIMSATSFMVERKLVASIVNH